MAVGDREEPDDSEEEDEDYDPTKDKDAGEKKDAVPVAKERPKRAAGAADDARPPVLPTRPEDPLAELKENAKKARIDGIWSSLKAAGSAPLRSTLGGSSKPVEVAGAGVIRAPAQNGGASSDLSRSCSNEARPAASKDAGPVDLKAAAAAALAAAAKAASAVVTDGKVIVTERKDFAGEQVTITKTLSEGSKEALALKKKAEQKTTSGIDSILESLGKKKKASILDKSRADWGGYKEAEGHVAELEEHKKSSATYTDRVAFLERTEVREYERERDLRMSALNKRPRPNAGGD
eukprot:jgi/Mesvir1/7481/Mv19243-RA.1